MIYIILVIFSFHVRRQKLTNYSEIVKSKELQSLRDRRGLKQQSVKDYKVPPTSARATGDC